MKLGPVEEMVERIVAGFDPLKVILFGSLARGEATYDSDADLLVVFREVNREDKRRLTVEIRRTLADVPFPKDVVVADLEEIGRRGVVVGTVLHRTLAEGEALYERPGRPMPPRAEEEAGGYTGEVSWKEFKRSLDYERRRSGDRLLFPEG